MKHTLAIASFLSSCLLATAAFAADPRQAIDALSAAMAAKDKAVIEAAFTADAGYAYSLDGDLNRGDKFDNWLQSDIVGPGSVFTIDSAAIDGGKVDALVVWGRGTANRPARYIFTVIDGKIDGWRMVQRP